MSWRSDNILFWFHHISKEKIAEKTVYQESAKKTENKIYEMQTKSKYMYILFLMGYIYLNL